MSKHFYVKTATYKTWFTGTHRLALANAKHLGQLYTDANVSWTLVDAETQKVLKTFEAKR